MPPTPGPAETPPGTSGQAQPRTYSPAPLTIGRTVHYVARGSKDGVFPATCRAAIVTETGPDPAVLGLCVLNPSGMFFHPLDLGGAYRQDGESSAEEFPTWARCGADGRVYHPGTWHLPEGGR